jgi:hypothetical protein
MALAGGGVIGAMNAVDCAPRPVQDDPDAPAPCSAGLIDPGFRRQHWCHLNAGHDGGHVCPNGDATWVEVGTEPADPDVEWNGPMRP